jgi:hypothetical protein
MGNREIENAPTHAFRQSIGPVARLAWKDYRELLASVAGDDLARSPMSVRHRLGHGTEAGVSRLMAELVVVGLEGIDIEEHERERRVEAARAAALLVERVVECPPVED